MKKELKGLKMEIFKVVIKTCKGEEQIFEFEKPSEALSFATEKGYSDETLQVKILYCDT